MYGHIRRVTAQKGVVAITEDREVIKRNNYFRIAYVISPNIWEADPVFGEVPKTAFDEDAPNELLVMTFHLRKKNKVASTSEIDLVRALQQQLKKKCQRSETGL